MYALSTRFITAIKSLIHYKVNSVTNPITGTAEEYPALLSVPNPKLWTKALENDMGC